MKALHCTLLVAVQSFGAGCVTIPHPVPAEIVLNKADNVDQAAMVSIGPRLLLERIANAIDEIDENMLVVNSLEFRDAAFPAGGWRLQQLLETPHNEALPADFLVLMTSGSVTEYDEEADAYFPLLIGGSYGEQTSRIDALLFNLRERRSLGVIEATATGRPMSLTWVVVTAVKYPMTGSAVMKALPEAIVETLREQQPDGTLSVAVLALESGNSDSKSMQKDSEPMDSQSERVSPFLSRTKNARAAYIRWYDSDKHSPEAAAQAIRDLCDAANEGYESALLDLTELFMSEKPSQADSRKLITTQFPPDNRIAYMWYSLWAGDNEVRLKLRNEFAERLSANELAEAEEYHRSWKPGNCPLPSSPINFQK